MRIMIAQVSLSPSRLDPPVPLEVVIAQHGPWRVLRAALAVLLRGDGRRPLPMDDHLRRDIGLEPLPRQSLDWQQVKR